MAGGAGTEPALSYEPAALATGSYSECPIVFRLLATVGQVMIEAPPARGRKGLMGEACHGTNQTLEAPSELAVVQDMPDRLPVNGSCLHRYMRAIVFRQPLRHPQKVRRGGLEGPRFGRDCAPGNKA